MALPPEFERKRKLYQVSSTSNMHFHFKFNELLKLFLIFFSFKFQSNPHLPVWLKAGTSDRIIYGAILTLCVVGFGSVLEFAYSRLYK